MSVPDGRPCICGCGALIARNRSVPLCPSGTARAWALMREIPLRDEPNARARRQYRFWNGTATVAAALAADRAGATA